MIRLAFGILIATAILGLSGCAGSGTSSSPAGFTLSATPSNPNVGQGGRANSTIAVVVQNGFNGSVALSASGLPSGVTAAFNPPSTSTTSVLTLTATSAAPAGTSTVTITGTSGNLAPTTSLSLTVALPSATVSLSPVRSSVAATTQTQQFTATVTSNVSNLAVNWSVDTIIGGNTTIGTISASGLYIPPATGGSHTVTATSVAVPTAFASASVAVSDLAGVFTYHNDLSRDGANQQEYALTTTTVANATFGKLFSCTVDGAIYAQPLWVPGVAIAGATHNVLIVATQHDGLFAFDADASPCVTLWQVSLIDTMHGGTTGEGPIVWTDVGYCFGDVYPEVGVTGTPVIDPTTKTIYVVSASEIPGVNSGNCSRPSGSYFHRLHAIDLLAGGEKFSGPTTVAASVVGTGDGSSGGMVSFTSQLQHNRSGLALNAGTVYVPFSAHEDATPYHGWLFGFSASDLSQLPSVFNTTPNGMNGADGGIWGGGGTPAIDSGGYIYVATGNGVFDQSSGFVMENDYGDSVLKLQAQPGATANGSGLTLIDYFTPYDQYCLEIYDTDLGSGVPVLLPDQTSGGLPTHLVTHVGKEGTVYLINRDAMGNYAGLADTSCSGSNSQIVQSFNGPGGLWGTPAFWQNGLYYAGFFYPNIPNPLTVFSFNPTTGVFNTTPGSQSVNTFGFPTTSPSVSSQGATNGIAWAIDASLYGYASPNAAGGISCSTSPLPAACSGPAILHAYDATNLASEIWNSSQVASDVAGNAVKFVPPTVANGKVYVGTRTEVDVYGLLSN